MPKFIGTSEEFKYYIGPRLRNKVADWTRIPKRKIGYCQKCYAEGETLKLEAAHRSGKSRLEIITDLLLPETIMINKGVDVIEFESLFKAAHEPFQDVMLALCKKCHRKYDNGNDDDDDCFTVHPVKQSGKRKNIADILPIELSPNPPNVFKEKLLRVKRATITIHYKNGKQESKPWNANRFKPSSDVMRNLRSRSAGFPFRAGEWQKHGIDRVCVSVP